MTAVAAQPYDLLQQFVNITRVSNLPLNQLLAEGICVTPDQLLLLDTRFSHITMGLWASCARRVWDAGSLWGRVVFPHSVVEIPFALGAISGDLPRSGRAQCRDLYRRGSQQCDP
jgi:hypothetical protein